MQSEVGGDRSAEIGKAALLDKASAVLWVLKEDIRAADLKISLFAAASKSFRHDTCLKPFPPYFINNGERDVERVRTILSNASNLGKQVVLLQDRSYISENAELIELLYFILCTLKEPCLRMVPTKDHESVLKKVTSEDWASHPQYIIQMSSDESSPAEQKWKTLSQNKNTQFAYHGSRLENFHSILHHGLQQHMSKTVVFGSGIYLSSELSVSLPYSPGGTGWAHSGFGTEVSCVALCEIINNHEGVYCQKKDFSENSVVKPETSRSKLDDSIAGEVPNKYYVISNNDLVRVRYLLVYTKDKKFGRQTDSEVHQVDGGLRNWFSTYRLLLGYTFMLAAIGLATNNNLQYYFKILIKTLDKAMKVLEI